MNRFFLLSICLLAVCAAINTAAHAAEPHLLPSGFQNGDLLLRRGEGIFSDIARNFSATDKRFSHVGIIVSYQHLPHVVHSVHEDKKGFDGVVIESLGDFLKEATDWAVYRLKLKKDQQQKFALTALKYAQKNIPFDPHFDLTSSNEMYCTEFIWRVSSEIARPSPIEPVETGQGAQYISIEDIYKKSDATLIESLQHMAGH